MSHARRPTTLAELKASGWQSRTVKDEVRENFLRMLQAGEELFPGIVGYDDTVIPEINIALLAGHDVLFDIDWQGAQQLYQEAGPDVVRVFILPPSIDELERRLHSRAQDSDAVIADRMSRAKAEIGHWDGYDYVLINDDVQACFEKIQQILAAERMKRRRQKGLIGFVRDLAAT